MSGKRAKHGRKIEAEVLAHEGRFVVWNVIECKCGWSSPLCSSKDDASKLYERHRSGKARKARSLLASMPSPAP